MPSQQRTWTNEKNCRSEVLPVVRIFPEQGGTRIEKGEPRERKSGREIESSGRWEDEWKQAGKKSCKKRDLPLLSPHSLAPWYENSATLRSLSVRATSQRLHRVDSRNREARDRRALNVAIWKRENLFFRFIVRSFSRSHAWNMNICISIYKNLLFSAVVLFEAENSVESSF